MQKQSVLYMASAMLPVFVFWWMDAKYLRLERLYRRLYDDVRNGAEKEPFDMRVDCYEVDVESLRKTLFNWSANAVYLTLLTVVAVVAVGFWRLN